MVYEDREEIEAGHGLYAIGAKPRHFLNADVGNSKMLLTSNYNIPTL